jgi:hypothetical protein
MKFAKVLGRIQTVILLFLIYLFVIGPISVIALICRKDFLDKRFIDKESYWRQRPSDDLSLESSKRQF